MVLPTKVGLVKASFAVDTGASVNVLSERAYLALKRASRGSRWPLRQNDKNLVGVSRVPLKILGIVRLPVRLGKGTATIRLDFYVVSDFSLPSDGLLGLKSMQANKMVIHTDTSTVRFQGKTFRAMDHPRCLISSSHSTNQSQVVLLTDAQTIPSAQDFTAGQNKRTTPNGSNRSRVESEINQATASSLKI